MDQVRPAVGLQTLLQSCGGLSSGTYPSYSNGDDPKMAVRLTRMGNIGVLSRDPERSGCAVSVQGIGAGLDDDEALVPALAEGLERYCMSTFQSRQFVSASADELGKEALDLDSIPRCSASELSHPKCPLRLPDKTKPIRWVRGLSLLDGSMSYVPAVMVYSNVGFAGPAERFWLSISTGCAAHTSYERALLRGIYEVIERDAITITWLQKLSLPRIEVDCFPPPLALYWDRYMNGSRDLEYVFFDATTDLNVPTVYGLQIARHNRRVTTLVSCGTDTAMPEALAKVIRDMAALRPAFRKGTPVPDNWDDFTDLLHGAIYMASSERSDAFDFLVHTGTQKRLSQMESTQTEEAALRKVVATLAQRQLNTYVVDLSTDEAIRTRMRVLRVIIPALQPLSFRHKARYLGHPRLYDAPVRMGYPALPEEKLNPYPQPFA